MQVKKTYAFTVDFEQEEDGLWSVDIPALGVCAATGYTREEALESLQDLAQAYFDILLEDNSPLPEGIDSYAAPHSAESASGDSVVIVSI